MLSNLHEANEQSYGFPSCTFVPFVVKALLPDLRGFSEPALREQSDRTGALRVLRFPFIRSNLRVSRTTPLTMLNPIV